jgi:DNA-binding CsgD family transcriptional regulator
MSLYQTFKDYCGAKITSRATHITQNEINALVSSIENSPLVNSVQAYSILDFYKYQHLGIHGFDTYFGYKNVSSQQVLDIVHPEDAEAFGQLYYLCLEGLLSMPIPVKEIGHFTIMYRLQHANGHYIPVQETNNIIAYDEKTNTPLINLATISVLDVPLDNFKVNYYFKIKDEQGSVEIMSQYFSHYNKQVNIFKEKEIAVAKRIKIGLTSDEIAKELFLSKHSVDKYRKELLSKTNCKNSHELISYLAALRVI